MPTLVRLEGVKAKETPAVYEKIVSKMIDHINSGVAVTLSGNNGALNIWKDDDGYLRGESMKYCITTDKQIFSTPEQMNKWVCKWKK
jgi:transcription termination factor Rho